MSCIIYALMVGEYDSIDIHSAYTEKDDAEAAGALIEAHNGQSFEIIPITFNSLPDGRTLWSVIMEGGKVIECKVIGIDHRWHHANFEDGRLRVVTLAHKLEEAIEYARDQ